MGCARELKHLMSPCIVIWIGLLFTFVSSRSHPHTQSEANQTELAAVEDNPNLLDELTRNNPIVGPLHIRVDLSTDGFRQLCVQPFGKFRLNNFCHLYTVCQNESLTIHKCPNSTSFDPSPGVQGCSIRNGCPKSGLKSDLLSIRKFLMFHKPSKSIEEKILEVSSRSQEKVGGREGPDSAATIKVYKDSDDTWKTSQSDSKVPSLSDIHEIPHPKSKSTTVTGPIRYLQGEKSHLCPSSTNLIFAYSGSCRHFLECIKGTIYIQQCPEGTAFNPILSVCDSKESVQCAERRNANLNYNGVKRSVPEQAVVISQAEFPSLGSKQLPIIMPLSRHQREVGRQQSRKCSLSEDYIQPHSVYCNKFEICSNGNIKEQTCGVGALFNPLSLVCDFPHNVDCKSRLVDYSTYDCQKGDKYRASHPENCEQFIECDKGTLHIKTCPPSTAFNYAEGECDHIYKAKCKKPISLEHDTDDDHISRSGRSSQKNSLNLDCSFNYIAPHPIFCNKFVECEDKRIFVKDCGPGTVYNPLLGQCDWAYNTRKEHPRDCRRYLECERGRYAEKACFRNTVFNPKTGKCAFSSGNECSNVNYDYEERAPPPS